MKEKKYTEEEIVNIILRIKEDFPNSDKVISAILNKFMTPHGFRKVLKGWKI